MVLSEESLPPYPGLDVRPRSDKDASASVHTVVMKRIGARTIAVSADLKSHPDAATVARRLDRVILGAGRGEE